MPNVTVQPAGNLTVVSVSGPLKLGHPALDELREALRQLADSGGVDVVLDLAGMPAFDSTGIGVLTVGYTSMKRRGGTIKLANVAQLARQMLKTVGLLAIFEVYDSREQALASFSE